MSEAIRSTPIARPASFAHAQSRAMGMSVGAIAFYSLLTSIALTAIPYGAPEPWWKAFFQCVVFIIAAISICDTRTSFKLLATYWRLFLPLLVLIAYAFSQTLPWVNRGSAISADAFQTKLSILQLVSFLLVAGLLIRYVGTVQRVVLVIDVLMGIGFVSACFGVLRQLMQRDDGFLLPNLERGFGYAQFINANHFAFLMEMVLGLGLGIAVLGGVKGTRRLIYLCAALPMWIALVLSNSRGGIVSGVFQVVLISLTIFNRGSHKSGATTLTRLKTKIVNVILVFALLSIATIAVVYVGGDSLAGRIDSARGEFNNDTARTYVLRKSIWQATWKMIKDQPMAGVGFGGYWMAITRYHDAPGDITPQQAHNDYLEFIASGGIIAVAIVIWFVFEFARYVLRALRRADAFGRAVRFASLLAVATVAVHSLTDFGLHIPINALLLTVLLTLAVIELPRRSLNVNEGALRRPDSNIRTAVARTS